MRTGVGRIAKTSVFISHSHEETAVALSLKERLLAEGVQAFSYENDLPYGAPIPAELRDSIAGCDHFLVILSDAARASHWVAREIDFALGLQQSRKRQHPSMLGVRCASPCTDAPFHLRDFNTGNETGRTWEFSGNRSFDVSKPGVANDVGDLVHQLSPRVTIISSLDDSLDRGLLRESFECYLQLFPDEAERDLPGDIERWIEEARQLGPAGTPFREVYAVLHMNRFVIGMAYVTAHVDSRFCFGNYFGVRAGYRQLDRAGQLKDDLVDFLHAKVDPRMKGTLFEVEEIDFDCLARVEQVGTLAGSPEKEAALRSLRRVRRLQLYQDLGKARAFIGLDGRPLPYRQPAMEDSKDPKSEVPLILMMMPMNGGEESGSIDFGEVAEFVFDRLYGDAYGSTGSINIKDFREYMSPIKNAVLEAAGRGWQLNTVPIDRKIRKLFDIARVEDLDGQLDL